VSELLTEGLIETVGFKKTTECMWWRTSVNASSEWVPYWGDSNERRTCCTLHFRSTQRSPREAKVVWTRRTDNRLVLEEHREHAGMWWIWRHIQKWKNS